MHNERITKESLKELRGELLSKQKAQRQTPEGWYAERQRADGNGAPYESRERRAGEAERDMAL